MLHQLVYMAGEFRAVDEQTDLGIDEHRPGVGIEGTDEYLTSIDHHQLGMHGESIGTIALRLLAFPVHRVGTKLMKVSAGVENGLAVPRIGGVGGSMVVGVHGIGQDA